MATMQWEQRLSLKQLPQLQRQVHSFCHSLREGPVSSEDRLELARRLDDLRAFVLRNDADKRVAVVERLCGELQEALHLDDKEEGLEELEELEEEQKDREDGQHSRAAVSEKQQRRQHDAAGKSRSKTETEMETETRKKNAIRQHQRKLVASPPPRTPDSDDAAPENRSHTLARSESSAGSSSRAPPAPRSSRELEPAQAARAMAEMSYAAAHNGGTAFLSPFGNPEMLRSEPGATSRSEGEDAIVEGRTHTSGNKATTGKQVLAKFRVRLNEQEYFEVLRRREIIRAARKGHARRCQHEEGDPLRVSQLRREQPYRTGLRESPPREVNRSHWVSDHDFN